MPTIDTPHLYVALLATHRHKLPPSLWAELWRGRCADCDAPIVAHAATLKRMVDMLPPDELRIVCGPCGRPAAQREHLELIPVPAGFDRHFRHG